MSRQTGTSPFIFDRRRLLLASTMAFSTSCLTRSRANADWFSAGDTKSVSDFGVLPGQPSEDASVLINRAIINVHENGGGTLIVPDGEYWLQNPIVMRSNVTLKGKHDSATLIFQDVFAGITSDSASCAGPSGTLAKNIVIENLILKGDAVQAIRLDNVRNSVIRKNKIRTEINKNFYILPNGTGNPKYIDTSTGNFKFERIIAGVRLINCRDTQIHHNVVDLDDKTQGLHEGSACVCIGSPACDAANPQTQKLCGTEYAVDISVAQDLCRTDPDNTERSIGNGVYSNQCISKTTAHGIDFRGGRKIEIEGNHVANKKYGRIINKGHSSSAKGYGIVCYFDNRGNTASRVRMWGNRVENTEGMGIYYIGDDAKIIENVVFNCLQYAPDGFNPDNVSLAIGGLTLSQGFNVSARKNIVAGTNGHPAITCNSVSATIAKNIVANYGLCGIGLRASENLRAAFDCEIVNNTIVPTLNNTVGCIGYYFSGNYSAANPPSSNQTAYGGVALSGNFPC